MAPKKPSGFMEFVMELKRKHGINVEQAKNKANPLWQAMAPSQKEAYNRKAKSSVGFKEKEKLTCNGVPVSVLEREREEEERKQVMIKNTISSTIQNASRNGVLESLPFLFVSVNYFNRSIEGDVYIPAEISISEFNLAEGIKRTFHAYINPGATMYGHLYNAKQHAHDTHKLPLPPDAMGETDLRATYKSILKFIENNKSGVYPPLYTTVNSIEIVQSSLNYLASQADLDDEVDLKIYSIQHLFFVLKDETAQLGEQERPNSHFVTDTIFDSDVFEYQADIACDYHEQIDRTKYCTKSCVIRWGYMFADYMLKDIAIIPIPGRHCPSNTNIDFVLQPNDKKPKSDVAAKISHKRENGNSSRVSKTKFDSDNDVNSSYRETGAYPKRDFDTSRLPIDDDF